MTHPVNPSRGFFSNLSQGFKDYVAKPTYDALHPFLGFSPRSDFSTIFNPIIEHLDQDSIDPIRLKMQLTNLSNDHPGLLNYETTELLQKVLPLLDDPNADATKKQLASLSGSLKKMRLQTAGLLSSQHMGVRAEPIFTDLASCFQHIRSILSNKGALEDLPKHAAKATELLTKLNKETDRYFFLKKLTPKQRESLRSATIAFAKFSNLPPSLQTLCFDPDFKDLVNVQELHQAIKNFSSLLDTTISAQTANTACVLNLKQDFLEAAKNVVIDPIKKGVNGLTQESQPARSYLQALYDSISLFCLTCNDYYFLLPSSENKWSILFKLADKINLTLPGFKEAFEKSIDACLSDNNMNDLKQLFERQDALPGCFKEALETALRSNNRFPLKTSSCEELLKFCNDRNLTSVNPSTIPMRGENFEPKANFFELLSHLGSSNLAAYGIPFLESLINSERIESWIGQQSEQTQTSALEFKAKAKELIEVAKHSKTQQAYKEAFSGLKDLWNSYQMSLHGFPLPNFSDPLDTTDLEAVEAVDNLEAMRESLEAAEPERAASEKLTKDQIREKIEKEKKDFGQNLQDFLTFKILSGYFLGKKETTFYHIKQAQMSAAPGNREDFFQNEMKRDISQSSLNWFTKKAILLFFPFIYRFVGRYTKNLVSNFETEINKHISSLDKNKLLLRSSNCFSQYNALLKTWADKPEGGDKDVVIGELMKEKRFLSFKDASFSQKTLYEKLSFVITTKYFNLFSGPNGNVGPSSRLDKFKQKINAIVEAPVFNNRRGSFTNTLNKLCIAIKWATLGIPAHVTAFVASLPVKGWENLMNRLVVKAAHSYLGDYQVLHSLFDATKKDVFENDTYVYPITRFFADQFETLSRTLTKGIEAGEDEKAEDAFVLSDQARASLKTTFQNLFEVIRKNAFTTQDELKAFVEKEKGMTGKLKDDFDALLIDNIIDITYKAYQGMLSKDSLQNSVLMLLENLNQSLLADPAQSEEKKQADHLKHQKAQEKLTKYSEKVLHQIIDQVITNGLDSMTHNQSASSTQFITWIKNDLKALGKEYDESLDQLRNPNASAQDKLVELKKLHQTRAAFQDQLESKFARFREDNSRVAQTFKSKLDPVFLQLNKLLEKQLEIYNKQNELCLLENDKPYFSACLEAFDSLAASLDDLCNDNLDDKDKKETIETQFEFLKSYLKKIEQRDASLELQRASQNYDVIAQEIAQNREAFTEHFEKILKRLNERKSLQIIESFTKGENNIFLLHDLVRDKKQELNQGRMQRLLYQDATRQLQNTHQTIQNTLAHLDIDQDSLGLKTQTLTLIKELMRASSSQQVDDIARRLRALDFTTAITTHKNLIDQAIEKAKEVTNELHHSFNTLVDDFDHTIDQNTISDDDLEEFEEGIQYLEAAYEDLRPMNFIEGEIDSVNALKKVPHGVVYHAIKPKMQGILDLLRNGNFAQFFVNHALVMPLVS